MPCALLLLSLLATAADPELRTASTHPMKYHVSLPAGWTKDRTWPIVVLIPDAHRDFAGNLAAFEKVRRDRPYILVTPHVVTSGGRNYRLAESYRYTDDDWMRVTADGDGRFDEEGVAAVLNDIRRLFHGEDRSYLTGWEAGGHTVWALTFRHPEWFRAVAPVSTNYHGRWLDDESFSKSPARSKLPILVLFCEKKAAPEGWQFMMSQSRAATQAAADHGFQKPALSEIPGKPHGPLAHEVLKHFDEVRAKATPDCSPGLHTCRPSGTPPDWLDVPDWSRGAAALT